jgi:hypothetical protein
MTTKGHDLSAADRQFLVMAYRYKNDPRYRGLIATELGVESWYRELLSRPQIDLLQMLEHMKKTDPEFYAGFEAVALGSAFN